MSENPLSVELQQFIAQYVHSVEQLEILCLLSAHPQEAWQASKIFRTIQSNERSITERLKRFAEAKLVTVDADGGYRLSPEAQAFAKELAMKYHERRVAIIEQIYKQPTLQIRDFAEAFRLKRKE